MNSIKNTLAAAAVGLSAMSGQGLANSPLTETEQLVVDVALKFNQCMKQEGTPFRRAAIDRYERTVEQIESDYKKAQEQYFSEFRAWTKEYERVEAELGFDTGGVPVDLPELAAAVMSAEMIAMAQQIKEILEKQTGLTEPVDPYSAYRIQLDGLQAQAPLSASRLCSYRYVEELYAANIDPDWDMDEIVGGIIEKYGPDVYLQLVTPKP